MACSLTLPFWPTVPGCIHWSKDNHIAVAGGGSIAIIVPRLKGPGPDGTNWDTAVFSVNAFTASEIPHHAMLSRVNFSIGEETSQWAAVRAVWSSPGLASHRSCALAVLTSNHVLSIWAADGKPNVNTNWRRHLVVNHALKEHYNEAVAPGDEDSELRSERLRTSQRILTFAWSHPLHTTRSGDEPELKNFQDWGSQFLALVTGCGDILIFRVQSSHLDRTSQWNLSLTDSFSVSDHVTSAMLEPHQDPVSVSDTYGRDAKSSLVADAVEWSDWSQDEPSGEVATLAFIVNGRLFTTKVRGNLKNELAEAQFCQPFIVKSVLPECSDLSSELLKIVSDAEAQFIVVVGPGRIYQIPIDCGQDVFSHHLDDRWDDITGVAVCRQGHGKCTLHVISLLSSARASTAEIGLPLQAGDKGSPSWQYALNASRASYSAELDLEGGVLDRTYGIVSSPFSNYVAICSTMHPSDSLGYVIGSEQASVLNISLEITPLYDEPVSAPKVAGKAIPISVETLIFEEKRRIENSMKFADAQAPDHHNLTEQILRVLPRHHMSDHDSIFHNTGLHGFEALVRLVKTSVCFDSELQGCRAALLAGFILDLPVRRDHVMRKTVEKLVKIIPKIPTIGLYMDDASHRILRIYRDVLSILESNKAITNPEALWQEECRICSSPISLVSVKWATCTKGHSFSRCALSFLSIPGPGATKSCGICNALFLNEQTLPGFTSSSNTGKHTAISGEGLRAKTMKKSLVDVLFTACDVCIYCGGRFVDQ